jgi:hypothetical protein
VQQFKILWALTRLCWEVDCELVRLSIQKDADRFSRIRDVVMSACSALWPATFVVLDELPVNSTLGSHLPLHSFIHLKEEFLTLIHCHGSDSWISAILRAMSSKLTRSESFALLTLSVACFGVLANVFQGDGNPVSACLAFSGLAFSFSYSLIRWLGDTFIKAGFKGQDMSKVKKVVM